MFFIILANALFLCYLSAIMFNHFIIPSVAVALVAPAVLSAQDQGFTSCDEAVKETITLLKEAIVILDSVKDADTASKAVAQLVLLNQRGKKVENYLDRVPDVEEEAAFKKNTQEIQMLFPLLLKGAVALKDAQYHGNADLKRQVLILMDDADDAADDAKEAVIGDSDDDDDMDND